MSQTIDCSVAEFLERINRGEIPRVATIRGTVDFSDSATLEDSAMPQTLKDRLGYEPQRAATMEKLEADRAEFDEFYKNLNETRRELGMRTL